MAKSNDMPEFHSVKVSLTENILAPVSLPEFKAELKHAPAANAVNLIDSKFASGGVPLISLTHLTYTGGWYHV
ncbi:hypothetical protein SG34_025465 [Thalassomonas viridans]|uniref:Uncharacterized protein n=1 Tax=Thalassomonas viridans TaxID=137584 RepID=A0AAE9Z243_9GAMM|nr:hypothetical protein [Thalassomonas viridans]WDE04640.1 hypothetical protein SG34_025465 [Thalassomonas viridans]